MMFEMMVDRGGCIGVDALEFRRGASNKLIADFTGNKAAGLT
jgi:hypothetical protein